MTEPKTQSTAITEDGEQGAGLLAERVASLKRALEYAAHRADGCRRRRCMHLTWGREEAVDNVSLVNGKNRVIRLNPTRDASVLRFAWIIIGSASSLALCSNCSPAAAAAVANIHTRAPEISLAH